MKNQQGIPARIDSAAQEQSTKKESNASGQIPTVSLPKGGGAIRGMGEKFTANPVTGTASLSVPFPLSPSRSGFGPQFSLSYDSGAGNGPFGFGWSMSVPSITRKTDKGLPRYDDASESDVFVLSGAEDLVPVSMPDVKFDEFYSIQRYRPRIEGLFSCIERWTRKSDGDTHWRSISKENILTIYGKGENSRITEPSLPMDASQRVFSWLICEVRDDKGNAVIYKYKSEDDAQVPLNSANESNRGKNEFGTLRFANRYLKSIFYGNRNSVLDEAGNRPAFLTEAQVENADWMFEVVLDFGEHDMQNPKPNDLGVWNVRLDPFSSYRSGFEVRTYRLCNRIMMFHHFQDDLDVGENCLVRSIDLQYRQTVGEVDEHTVGDPTASFVTSMVQTSYRRKPNGLDGYDSSSLPPLEFEYSRAEIDGDKIVSVDRLSLENLPAGIGQNYQWVDLDGEGLSGILSEQADGWFYKRNISAGNRDVDDPTRAVARFDPIELIKSKPNTSIANGSSQFLDLAGDGQIDLVQLEGPVRGFYERTPDGRWDSFRSFLSNPNIDIRNPNLKFIDLDGDGHADILISEDDVFTWYASVAEDGYGPACQVRKPHNEESGPQVLFADGTQTIFLADMSGDGLTDIVRITSSQVCYWPNLGYGRFGAKVTMDDAPCLDHCDSFDPRRIRLADIDGSGVTDVLYLSEHGVKVSLNKSGNSWSPLQTLPLSPRVDNLSEIQVVDLLGNGTACLVWSSPLPGDARRHMAYVDLMSGRKPHLLTRVTNNLGTETRIRYAPSTRFYLEDKEAGQPWITRLPFPVHVVEQVETIDFVSRNRFVSQYKYHHGYFDGEEREFRGFGMVEQIDTEAISVLSVDGIDLQIENAQPVFHAPPIHTKTWFHTGVFVDGDKISRQLAHEYFGAPIPETASNWKDFEASLLPDTVISDESNLLSCEEMREACRALKGSILRQEVYANYHTPHDLADDKSRLPYTVSERNYTVEILQRRGDNRHAVFFSHARETIDYHYERNVDDPRVSHSFILKVDRFGNIERSAAVGYGRALDRVTLTDSGDRAKQLTTLTTFEEHKFTNAIGAFNASGSSWRTPLPCEVRTFELTGTEVGSERRFSFETINKLIDQAQEIPYEAAPDTTTQKRLIEHVRMIFRRDDLSGLLPLGELESLALPGESYKLAFTPGLIAQIFEARATDSLLHEGKYVHSRDRNGVEDANWWISSGRTFFHKMESENDVELDEARAHFFLTRRVRDPFGNETLVDYDQPNDLLPIRTIDPLQNVTSAQIDYRVLQSKLVTDPNGDQAAASFDILGMVVGTALIGSRGEGDSLVGFKPDISDTDRNQFFTTPRKERGAIPFPGSPLIQNATTRIIYDLHRFHKSRNDNPNEPEKWLPVVAATIVRETHAKIEDGTPSILQVSFSYSDGFGREIQKKVQAEPGPLVNDGPPRDPRWISTGWTVFNNKGKPVRQYEPFFDDTHEFKFGNKVGVSPVVFYDPAERVVATLNPNNTYGKVVFDPWQHTTYDMSDTCASRASLPGTPPPRETGDPRTDPDIRGYVAEYFKTEPENWKTWYQQRIDDPLRPDEQKAAQRAAAHADTPSTVHLDALGRPFLTVARNRVVCKGHLLDGTEESFSTRVVMDIEGNQREVRDERKLPVNHLPNGSVEQRVVMRYAYDMLGNKVHQNSMEAGRRWTLLDVVGKPIRAWDDRGFVRSMKYDSLHRPTDLTILDKNGVERLAERSIYGESKEDAKLTHHLGKIWKTFDDAGVLENQEYDFKGNLLKSYRELRVEYKQPANWLIRPGVPDPEPRTGVKFTTTTKFDALNRPIEQTTPDDSVTIPGFNEANLLDRVAVRIKGLATETVFVRNIEYDAKGQRQRIEYNSEATPVVTEYQYDPLTFRLVRLKTVRPLHSDPSKRLLQDLTYTYDPVGNITHIQDDAQQTIYFNNTVVEPHNDYVYDAVYRLIQARGREHLGQIGGSPIPHSYNDAPRVGRSHPSDGKEMGTYTERYVYDAVGNFLSMKHTGNNPLSSGWTREYNYVEDSQIEPGKKSNRLSSTTIDGNTETYADATLPYDSHGNMPQMPHLNIMQWDCKDQLQMTQRQAVNAFDEDGILHNGERTFYVYDALGERVRKVTVDPTGGLKKERTYLGVFEVFREYTGPNAGLVRETLHVTDDNNRIALIETRNDIDDGSNKELVRYQFSDRLLSVCMELDDAAVVIYFEEYSPYGSTVYHSRNMAIRSAAKRYRYSGKERDEETGLAYHSARYYAPWLARWMACDPIGLTDGPNLYLYGRGNPVTLSDPRGTATHDPVEIGNAIRRLEGQAKNIGVEIENLKERIGRATSKLNDIEDSKDLGFWDKRSIVRQSKKHIADLNTQLGNQEEKLRDVGRQMDQKLMEQGQHEVEDYLRTVDEEKIAEEAKQELEDYLNRDELEREYGHEFPKKKTSGNERLAISQERQPTVNPPPEPKLGPMVNVPPRFDNKPMVNVPPPFDNKPMVNVPPRFDNKPMVNVPPPIDNKPVVSATPSGLTKEQIDSIKQADKPLQKNITTELPTLAVASIAFFVAAAGITGTAVGAGGRLLLRLAF